MGKTREGEKLFYKIIKINVSIFCVSQEVRVVAIPFEKIDIILNAMKLKKIVLTHVRIFIKDVTSHLFYTFFIIALTLLSYVAVTKLINKKLAALTLSQSKNNRMAANNEETPYVEQGSPYDNRTIGSESANVIFHGPRDKKKVSLTFDAEMTDFMRAQYVSGKVKSSYDARIVDVLNQTHTKATFFLTGMWIELYPQVTKELSRNPLFELGSHSYSDSSYSGYCYGLKQIPATVKIEDIGATEKLLRTYAGIDNTLFRFPGGCYTPTDVKLVNQAGDMVVHWDVAGVDGFNTNTDQIVRNVVDNVQNGSIVVLHMNGAPSSPKTGDALPMIISRLKEKGFEFVKINELLGLPPEANG